MDAKDSARRSAKRGIKKVKVGGLRHRRGPARQVRLARQVLERREGGMGFCDVIFGWDIGDVLYDNARRHRLAHRLPRRARAASISSTFRVLPWEPDTAAFLARLRATSDGTPHAACPRRS